VVVTVFGGGPDDWSQVTDWDARCGFRAGDDVVAARRAEDRRALAVLGAVASVMDIPEDAYRAGDIRVDDVAGALSARIDEIGAAQVVIPLGLHHPDHRIASDAALAALRDRDPSTWLVYGDFYAFTHAQLIEPRMAELRQAGIELRRAELAVGPVAAKRDALRQYPSQLRALGKWVARSFPNTPELLWAPTR
jgi:LmbE family N-acetylglucosaminyl deacetylase